jgi:heme A synthase
MIKTEAIRETSRSSNTGATTAFTRYAWGVLAYNVLVVLWGAFVRATGSGAGCGAPWPMCNGVVVPRAPALATIIEFTHRATSGIALLAVVGLVVWAFRAMPKGHQARVGAVLSLVFILTEAALGAGLVLLEYVAGNQSIARGWWMSLHLINTFTLLAVLALTAWWASGRTGRLVNLPMLAAMMVLGVSGAIAALGDTLFPATSWSAALAQDLSPSAHLFVRLRVLHPAIAVAVAIWLLVAARKRISEPLGLALVILTFAQMMIGMLNLAMLAPVPMQIVHLAAADGLWIVAVLFSVRRVTA